jgi:hypothetical protein
MSSTELYNIIKRAVDRRTEDGIAHAVEYIRAQWNRRQREWIGWFILGLLLGLCVGIFVWQFI